jgi:ABC-type multidrug transport system ATPase subunit
MKMLSGLSKPTEGSVLFQQKDIFDDISAYHEHIIYISHQNKIYSDLTLIENLKLLNNLHPNRRSLADIMEISSEVNLDGYRDLPTKWFSSGMSRRAGLARIILTKPKLLILDEPYTGLDHKSILWFQSYLAAYRSQGGCVLITSHQIELALQLSDRVILLDQGKIKQDLPSDSVQMSDCYTWLEE